MPAEGPNKSTKGLARIWRATFYSLSGLGFAWRAEAAFRQEVVLAAILLLVATFLPASLTQKAILVVCVMLVLITELLNSAIESTVDRISLDGHELAKRAKDIGSAAVFVSLANLAIVWTMVLIDVYL